MLIGIGGVSRAGKSTLARLLLEALVERSKTVELIHQDDYVIQESLLPRIQNRTDWEVPQSIDWIQWRDQINEALNRSEIVIIEGIFCFYDERIVQQMKLKILIVITYRVLRHRKDEDLRWGSKPEPKWYIDHIWKSYRRYGTPLRADNYLILNGEKRFDIEGILRLIMNKEKLNDLEIDAKET